MKNYNHTLRLKTTEVKCYSRSNRPVNVSFDSLIEAKKHVENQLKIHPRSKFVNRCIRDDKYRYNYIFNKYSGKWTKGKFVNL